MPSCRAGIPARWAAEPWHQEEMEITDEIARRAAEKSEKAIFLIGRTAGEDKDYEDTEGSYLLTKREKENLRYHLILQSQIKEKICHLVTGSYHSGGHFGDGILYVFAQSRTPLQICYRAE